MAESTIFDRIISGEIPSHRVYEDDHVVAFLDVAPLSWGHLLLVPRESRPFLHELSDESAAAIGRVLPRLCRAVVAVTGCTAYNVLQNNGSAANQAVFHVHFHVIPRFENSGLDLGWHAGELDPAQGQELAARIREELS